MNLTHDVIMRDILGGGARGMSNAQLPYSTDRSAASISALLRPDAVSAPT